jgi:hypothetical protein
VAVLAIAGAVMAAESQNIVGYSKKAGVGGGFQILSPQFLTSATGGIPLGDAFAGVTDQSKVFAWNGSTYTEYTYFSVIPGWFDSGFQSAAGVIIGQGEAVWYKPGTTGDVLMLGEVDQSASITVPLISGFNLIANPYPVEITLGDLSSPPVADQDKAFVWNGSTYTEYTYFSIIPGWFDAGFQSADGVAIPVGDGFWLNSSAGGTLTINKPF